MLGPARKVVSPGEILMLSCCSLWRLVGIWWLGRGSSKDVKCLAPELWVWERSKLISTY